MEFTILFASFIFAFALVYILIGRDMLKYRRYSINFMRKINDFKNKSFSSYEEESKAKQQFRQELLIEINNMPIRNYYKKSLVYQVNLI
jgi:hypothetical protein